MRTSTTEPIQVHVFHKLILVLFLGAGVLGHVVAVADGLDRHTVRHDDRWRRTALGWEYANSLGIPSSNAVHKNDATGIDKAAYLNGWLPTTDRAFRSNGLHRLHRCLVPIAMAALLATFGSWLLLALPNLALQPTHVNVHAAGSEAVFAGGRCRYVEIPPAKTTPDPLIHNVS